MLSIRDRLVGLLTSKAAAECAAYDRSGSAAWVELMGEMTRRASKDETITALSALELMHKLRDEAEAETAGR